MNCVDGGILRHSLKEVQGADSPFAISLPAFLRAECPHVHARTLAALMMGSALAFTHCPSRRHPPRCDKTRMGVPAHSLFKEEGKRCGTLGKGNEAMGMEGSICIVWQ